jgi:hypothetical protein
MYGFRSSRFSEGGGFFGYIILFEFRPEFHMFRDNADF